MPTPIEHALLSASAAERWLNCTAAPRIEEILPDSRSGYADEGKHAHSVAELKARKKFTIMKPSAYKKELKTFQEDPLWQHEMDGHTDTYINFLTEAANEYAAHPYIALEVRVDYGNYAPEGFGTSDCIMIGGDTIHVIDFKYGKGVAVSAEENPQMMLYALGALNRYASIYGDSVKKIKVTIVQPRLDTISTWEVERSALEHWGLNIVKPAAEKAFKGEGEFKEGDWCQFCRAKYTCRARASYHTALEDFGFALSPALSNDEIGRVLVLAQRLKTWVSDLEEYALAAVLRGEDIAGWKAVEGRSNRKYADADKVLDILKDAGYQEALLFKPRELLGITEMEKLVGRKPFTELLENQLIKPPGKPTLAVLDDPRPPYSTAAADFKDVGA